MPRAKSTNTESADEQPEAAPFVTGRDEPAPKGASLEGLKDADEIEIMHPDTGQYYGVSVKAYHDLYEPLGYKPTRMGDNTLLPGDPRAPEPVAEPTPPIIPNPEGDNQGESA